MNEQQWKELQQKLQSIQPGEGDAPLDAQQFKRRVLDEYERRSRTHLRMKWWRMTAAALTLSAAVWAGVVVVKPALEQGGEPVRADGNSHMSDSNERNAPVDKQQQTLPQVKYERMQDHLPTAELTAFDSLQPSPVLDQLEIPAEKKVDVLREYGMYVLNGSVQSFSLLGGELRVEVSEERGKVQVMAVPIEQIKPFQGQSFEVQVYDESGTRLLEKQTVHIPEFER